MTEIPESVLKNILCAECQRYLSKGPIKLLHNGNSICGRCTHVKNFNLLPTARCYEHLIKLHTFPCCYVELGCSEKVLYNDTEVHEEECVFRIRTCPLKALKNCDWKGIFVDLPNHYQKYHPELYLKRNKFVLITSYDYELYYLLMTQGILFLFQIKCEFQESRLWFQVIHYGPVARAYHISYQLKFSGDDELPFMALSESTVLTDTTIQMVPDTSVQVHMGGLISLLRNPRVVICHCIINMTQQLSKSFKKLYCSWCDILMAPPIYRCSQKHFTCRECKHLNCKICNEDSSSFARVPEMEIIAESLVYMCRWQDCFKTFGAVNIRKHEEICDKRKYKCSICPDILFTELRLLQDHTRTAHMDSISLSSF